MLDSLWFNANIKKNPKSNKHFCLYFKQTEYEAKLLYIDILKQRQLWWSGAEVDVKCLKA